MKNKQHIKVFKRTGFIQSRELKSRRDFIIIVKDKLINVLQNTGNDLVTTSSMNGMSASNGLFPANACREGKCFLNTKSPPNKKGAPSRAPLLILNS